MEDENMIGKQRYSHINVKVLKGASYLDEEVSGRRQQLGVSLNLPHH